MKRKDITTKMVLSAYLESKKINKFPHEIIQENTGYPLKVIWSAIERDLDNDYIEYGVSMRTGWLTEKGLEYLTKL